MIIAARQLLICSFRSLPARRRILRGRCWQRAASTLREALSSICWPLWKDRHSYSLSNANDASPV